MKILVLGKNVRSGLYSIPFLGTWLQQPRTRRAVALFLKTWRSDVSFGRKVNYFLAGISSIYAFKRSLGRPLRVTIEPTTVCDQKCPICETGNGELARPKAFLAYEHFEKILNSFDNNLEQIFLYFMGETFLNKDAYRMIRLAADRGIHVASCTDGNFIKPLEMVKSGISEINIQIGGMTQETHEIYRVGGHLNKAMGFTEELVKLKKEAGKSAEKMRIRLGFIVMKHNEHEVEEFKRYATRIGVDSWVVISPCIRHVSEWDTYMTADPEYWMYDKSEYEKGRLVPTSRPDNFCGEIYSSSTILVNGDVVSCCRDPKGEKILGNVFKQDFYKEIWNGPAYRRLREAVTTQSNSLKLCSLCPGEGLAKLHKNK